MTKSTDSYARKLALMIEDRIIKTVIFYPFQEKEAVAYDNNVMYNQEGATKYLERERQRWYDCNHFQGRSLDIKEV